MNSTVCEHGTHPATRFDSPLRLDTLLLVLVAAGVLIVVRAEAAWNPTAIVIRAACELLVAVVASVFLWRRANSLAQARAFATIAISAAVACPFTIELGLRQFNRGGEPLEMLMLTSLQLVAVVLAVFSRLRRLGGTAIVLSSFLALFSAVISSNRPALVLAGVFGVLVLWWLMGAYWDRLAGALVASSVQSRIPVRLSVISATVIILFIVVVLIRSTGASAIALHGFMPTSGGTRWHDAYARSGVGDGDAMVRAKEDAMSFGPVESELFLESDMPTLYDMFNDLYGDPPKPKNKHERSISLAPADVKDSHQRIARNERGGREFAAVRRKVARQQRPLDDRQAAVMFYVVGRVPLHLALERFDTFDGRQWTHSENPTAYPPIRLENHNGKPWAQFMRIGASPIHRGLEPHALKLINLKTNRFPSPPQLTAVHIDRVDQADFFGWTSDGVPCMPVRDHIPQLTVIHLRSQTVNLHSLRAPASHAYSPSASQNCLRPAGIAPYEEILNQWTRSVPRGWRQVEAVLERLRGDFTLDPQATAPEDCANVVSHFLQTGRGPDYLFATTAAILLRELGYSTRLVTGFYARDDRFDRRAGQTPVRADDVHVWAEVNIDGSTWIAIEPTPGYQPPRESLTWQERLTLSAQAVWRWCIAKGGFLISLAMAAMILWTTRALWLDEILTRICWIAGAGSSRRRVLWTLRLLEWRARLAGCARPRSTTLSAWYTPLTAAPLSPEGAECLRQALRSAEQLLYGPVSSSADLQPVHEVTRFCSVVGRQLRVRRFRSARLAFKSNGTLQG